MLGSTNINEFACFSEEHYAKRNSELYFEAPKNTLYFKGTQLKVPVSTLDCGNIAMNSNLCTTLNAEKYPDIGIELIEVTSKDGQPLNITGLTTMIAKVKISMAGQTRLREIRFAGKQTSPGNYFFTGIHNILLSDYNIEAPEAFFGLIKVNDLIAVKFNLNVAAKMLDAD